MVLSCCLSRTAPRAILLCSFLEPFGLRGSVGGMDLLDYRLYLYSLHVDSGQWTVDMWMWMWIDSESWTNLTSKCQVSTINRIISTWINISGNNKIAVCCDFPVQLFFVVYLYKHFIYHIPCDIVFITPVIYTTFLTGYGPTVTILLLCIFGIDLG